MVSGDGRAGVVEVSVVLPGRVRVAVLTIALVSGGSRTAAQNTAAPIRLENRALRIGLDARDGSVVQFLDRATGHELVTASDDSVGLWDLHLMARAEVQRITPARAKQFRWARTSGSALQLTWSDFGIAAAPALRVRATVRLRGSLPMSEWRIQLDGIRGLGVDSVRFPRVTGIPSLGDSEELAVPLWMGQRTREPRKLLAGADGVGKRFEWFYPGQLSLQLVALYQKGGTGFYASADDSLAYRKSFALWGDAHGLAGYEMIHLPEDPGRSTGYTPPYAAVIGTFTGGWVTAAERYREWGTKQRWARESRLTRRMVPEWVEKTGLWVWNRGRSPVVLEPAAALQKELGLPVSVFWHWWHNGPYDTSFPDYLPPREGKEPFKAALGTAHADGLHAIVYMNQRLWCLNTPSWKAESAERFAVHKPDGTIRTEVYNIFDPQPCATMDVTTAGWRNKYAGIAEEVLNDYRLDGIYMDQAVLSLMDYSPDHGHPIGGGNYWMEGFTKLAHDIRVRAGRPVTLAGEGTGESWLSELDLLLALQVSMERYADPASSWEVIPFFQSVYHAYGITYGSYSSLAYPPYDDLWPVKTAPPNALQPLDRKYDRQFYLEQARSFVWGMQPTIANFLRWQLTDRRAEIDYALSLARLRNRFPQYLLHGTFLRPPTLGVPEVDVTISRVSIYASRGGGSTEYQKKSPAAIAGAWRAPNGKVAIAVASIFEEPLSLSLQLDPAAYGFTNGGRVYRVDGTSRQLVGELGKSSSTIRLDLGPHGSAVLEMDRAGPAS
jgi:hypothetical protein